MKKIIKQLLLTLSFGLSACISSSKKNEALKVTDITHYNVVIVPDLSNRLTRSNKVMDVAIIGALIQNIYPKIARTKRSTNQQDRYSVILSSKKLGSNYNADFSKMYIDLDEFKNDQHARIDYLTGTAKGRNLRSAGIAFLNEFARIEAVAKLKTDGADIWSFMNSGIDRNLVIYPGALLSFNNQQYRNVHRNILILLTDGYIEAGISGPQGCDGMQCRYLSGTLINKFRQAYRNRPNKSESLPAFFYRNNYGIATANNPYLKNFEILVLEADDRSLTTTGNATTAPTDFEIMKLFWEDWMKKSGVQHFEIHPIARDAGEAENNILSFMSIR